MKKIMAIACISALLFSSCKKEDNCNLTEQSLVGVYRLTGLTYRAGPSYPEENQYNYLDDCQKDDVFIFNADGTFYYQDAGLQCFFPGDDASYWRLTGTTLEFGGAVNNVTYFDCGSMTTTYYDHQGGVLTATYIRQ